MLCVFGWGGNEGGKVKSKILKVDSSKKKVAIHVATKPYNLLALCMSPFDFRSFLYIIHLVCPCKLFP